jgi:menaquinone-dependent protoporphyrinogen IX oxidase
MTEDKEQTQRILIAYASKGGATADIARWLSEGMKGADVDVLDVADVQSFNYDCIVLGAPIRLGKPHPSMVTFMEDNKEKLTAVAKALFVVCGFTFLGRRYLRRIKQHADGPINSYRVFGGKLGILNIMDKDYAREAGETILKNLSNRI